MVISSIEPVEVLERWTFDIQTTLPDAARPASASGAANKSVKEINTEIAAVMRQIAASVTFLPLLETACSFDLLMYTDHGAPVPVQWEESAPRYIANAQHVRLRSVDTSVRRQRGRARFVISAFVARQIHKVDTAVAYRVDSVA